MQASSSLSPARKATNRTNTMLLRITATGDARSSIWIGTRNKKAEEDSSAFAALVARDFTNQPRLLSPADHPRRGGATHLDRQDHPRQGEAGHRDRQDHQ